MHNKLQELTDKLYNEGLSKGKQEGEEILAKAKVQAEEIIAKAKAEAEAIRLKGEAEGAAKAALLKADADNFTQMIRRLRYMQEYSKFQKAQGELLKAKQLEVKEKQNELLAAKARKEQNLHAVEQQKKALQGMKENCQTQVAFLNKNISTVRKQIQDYQKKEQALNAEIDRIIKEEIEAARRAEEERKRKAEAEAREKAKKLAEAKADAYAQVADANEELMNNYRTVNDKIHYVS